MYGLEYRVIIKIIANIPRKRSLIQIRWLLQIMYFWIFTFYTVYVHFTYNFLKNKEIRLLRLEGDEGLRGKLCGQGIGWGDILFWRKWSGRWFHGSKCVRAGLEKERRWEVKGFMERGSCLTWIYNRIMWRINFGGNIILKLNYLINSWIPLIWKQKPEVHLCQSLPITNV